MLHWTHRVFFSHFCRICKTFIPRSESGWHLVSLMGCTIWYFGREPAMRRQRPERKHRSCPPVLFSCFGILPRSVSSDQRRVHLVESVAAEADIDVHRHLDVGVPEQAGEHFHVHTFVVAVRGKGMTEDMRAAVWNSPHVIRSTVFRFPTV